jgi:hypothetical protein
LAFTLFGKPVFEVEKLDTLTGGTAIYIERKEVFAGLSPFAEQQVPTTRRATHSNWHLAQRVHRRLARGAIHKYHFS